MDGSSLTTVFLGHPITNEPKTEDRDENIEVFSNHGQSPFVKDLDNFPIQIVDTDKNCYEVLRAKENEGGLCQRSGFHGNHI